MNNVEIVMRDANGDEVARLDGPTGAGLNRMQRDTAESEDEVLPVAGRTPPAKPATPIAPSENARTGPQSGALLHLRNKKGKGREQFTGPVPARGRRSLATPLDRGSGPALAKLFRFAIRLCVRRFRSRPRAR